LRNRIKNFKKIIKQNDIKFCALSGYGRIEYILMIAICFFRGIKCAMFCESWYGNKGLKSWVKKIFLKIFRVKVFASGKRAENFMINTIGIKKENVFTPYSVVDNNHFDINQQYSPDRKTILCVARYTEVKNLEFLIDCFKKSKIYSSYALKLVGAGPLKEKLTSLIEEDNNITLSNWLTYKDLPMLYNSASWFILPSIFEPWGLVVNEAMAAGLPIIVSNCCGCLPDLALKSNSFVFDEKNKEELIAIFDKIASMDSSKMIEMSNASREIIKNYSTDVWAKQIVEMQK